MFVCQIAFSQVDSSVILNASSKTLKKLGQSAMKQNDPSSAVQLLEPYVNKNKSDAKTKMLLAIAYMQLRDYDRAQHMYLNAYKTNKEKAPEALFYHALMLKSNMQYDSAKINFQIFKKEYKGKQKELKRFAAKEITFCDSIAALMKVKHKIIVQHLDTSINKVNTEGAPINYGNDILVYTSLRTEKKEYILEDDTSRGLKRKLYTAKRKKGEWKFNGEFGEIFNDLNFNVGNATFSPDRKRVYFTRCKLNYAQKMICAIYVSEKVGDQWTEPVKLPKEINHPKYTSTMPAVTTDPLKGNDIIYFVSDNKKGKGGLDLWYSVYNKKTKKYKLPKNLGSKVNTPRDEISPFYDNETRTLYFSSDGLGGLGGYDIFKSRMDGKKLTKAENIGLPINSGADDIYYTVSTQRGEGFFVSNRKGGNALKNATCCDDIYFYKESEYVQLKLSGTVSDMLDPNDKVANALIEVYIKDKTTGEKFFVKTITTDKKGYYSTPVEAGQDYFLVVKKDDYLGSSTEINAQTIANSKEIKTDLSLVKKPKDPVALPNILFEFDKWELLPSSKLSIDTTVFLMMNTNPELIIEIQAHTDGKGNDKYNLKLSQKRADAVVKYIISRGVDARRIKGIGYGETRPIAPNEYPDGRDNPEGRAKNRRTDFKIIGVVDAEIINESNNDDE